MLIYLLWYLISELVYIGVARAVIQSEIKQRGYDYSESERERVSTAHGFSLIPGAREIVGMMILIAAAGFVASDIISWLTLTPCPAPKKTTEQPDENITTTE